MLDEMTELVLKTWYPRDHELHLNPRYPLGRLLGEWGRLLDDYMEFVFEPEDKLGNIWYYLCVLSHQKNHSLDTYPVLTEDVDFMISTAMYSAAESFNAICRGSQYSIFTLDLSFSVICKIAEKYNLTLQQLMEGVKNNV